MATPFSEIYDIYSGMTTDYEHLTLPTEDQDEILEGWLLSAVAEFDNCKVDLSERDDTLKQFNGTLSDKEKKILARFILVEWLSPQLYSIDFLRSHLATKDIERFSPANLLKEIRETHDKAEKKANGEKSKYGYSKFDPMKELVR